jgi:hypothetical protein
MSFLHSAMRPILGVVLLVVAASILSVCGGGGGATTANGPTVPVTPTATPIPAPTAAPPLSTACTRLPAGNAAAACRTESATFQAEVDDAIRTLQVEQAPIFNDNEVLSVGQYYVGLIKILDRKGLCARFDGEELAVTNTHDFSDQYHVMASNRLVRIGPQSYRVTCYPAALPLADGALPPPPAGCSLPSSHEVACSRDNSGGVYLDDVLAAIAQVQRDKPDLFDFTQVNPGTNSPKLKDLDGYLASVVQILAKQGYCAQVQEELQIKRGSNTFSEQYKIDYSYQYVRTGSGIYRSSCYPAAF